MSSVSTVEEEHKDTNWYEILNVEQNASKSAIQKAYRKLALKVHPDTNKHDTKEEAERKFQLIKTAQEILFDDTKRAQLDSRLKAKSLLKKRKAETDARLSSLKNNLEAREAMAKKRKQEQEFIAESTKAQIERLRREGQLYREQQEKKIAERKSRNSRVNSSGIYLESTIKVRWNKNKWSYQESDLRFVFGRFGEIESVFIAGSKRAALISFVSPSSGQACISDETIRAKFKVEWASGKEDTVKRNEGSLNGSENVFYSSEKSKLETIKPIPKSEVDHGSLERSVLDMLGEAAQRQKQTKCEKT